MKKYLIATIISIFAVSVVSAQDYGTSVGVRVGGEAAGISVKHFFSEANAIEGIFAFPWKNGFTFTALYERHVPLNTDGLDFYYGLGGHIGSWQNRFALGVDAVAGIEYKFAASPFALSFDYKPVFNIAKKTKFYMLDFALSFKYTF